MARRGRTQPPLFVEDCRVCSHPTLGEHEPWCPSFMRGAEPGGDPHEWPSLLELEEDPATWTVPDDGYADGGTPYTPTEIETVDGLRHGDRITTSTGATFELETPYH